MGEAVFDTTSGEIKLHGVWCLTSISLVCNASVQNHRGGQCFHDRARLESELEDSGSAVFGFGGSRVIWINSWRLSSRQNLACLGFHDNRTCPLSRQVVDGVCQNLLGKELQIRIDCQVEGTTVLNRLSNNAGSWDSNTLSTALVLLLPINACKTGVVLTL